jgi:hypothetical protein
MLQSIINYMIILKNKEKEDKLILCKNLFIVKTVHTVTEIRSQDKDRWIVQLNLEKAVLTN